MELCAVLAELDGVGVPLGYLLINKSIPSVMKTSKPGLEQRNQVPQIAETSAPGTVTEILSLFLEYLRSKGFDPSFVGCDKDLAEINALRQVWPSAKIQLRFWHAKRAIKKKLSDSSALKYAGAHICQTDQTTITGISSIIVVNGGQREVRRTTLW
ncbi:hypothetical protein K3495_g15397 [Podosphaera aphanis]|nr:hypothetical protein K3495_g15397 [Podosphaera aphanis]